ncbi:hypothetical protein HMI01_02080 [Halolactibacillus miurensis]|uniref:Uncharacterized protein n=1 Tax=Halolactibacillus miurensis TaxID=306541 RepID=A0A1I6NZQ5_9BACI|nr:MULTISPECIES: hypothetical protein [Halolactibacillus]GEM03220.1 hypothetical protein HMI01_02080 [Halolactibacillus miurensis]SFS33432.1 hypothetical protein SAMN05421668_101100 [Halolactibacillus miurensis]
MDKKTISEQLIPDHYANEDVFTKEEWLELLKDWSIVKEKDLLMLKQMYEFGGSATATELSKVLGRHYTHYTALVIALAKRIYQVTSIDPFIGTDGKVAYWRVFFNGYKENNNH